MTLIANYDQINSLFYLKYQIDLITHKNLTFISDSSIRIVLSSLYQIAQAILGPFRCNVSGLKILSTKHIEDLANMIFSFPLRLKLGDNITTNLDFSKLGEPSDF